VRPLLVEGESAALQPGSNAVILGRDIADQLGVRVGDRSRCWSPRPSANGTPEPRLREFTVGGVFQAGLEDHDNTLILAHIDDVRAFAPLAQGASGLRLRFTDALQVAQFMPAVRAPRAAGYTSSDWTQENASYFRAIRIEKTMMALILLLIVAVAAFNIVAMLVMVVNDKRTDIAILRTFGTSPRSIMRPSSPRGWRSAGSASPPGVALGVLLARNVSTIVPVLERVLHFQFLDAEVYYITSIPSELHPARCRLDQRRGLRADAAVHDLSGAARRAYAAGRRAALRVIRHWRTNGCSGHAICARPAGAVSCRSSRWSRRWA
jgi:lipoprotein-releasing system permease protein